MKICNNVLHTLPA